MAKILVTGAAGFIGSHVAEALLRSGAEVLGLDEVNDYYPVQFKEQNIKLLKDFKNFSFVKGDIVDRETVTNVFSSNEISHVAHLAARAGVRPSLIDPDLYTEVNVKGTLNLLNAAKDAKVANFVLTSSSSVYGNSLQIPFRENDAATDKPISPYAATKKATELLGYTYHHLYGLNINVIRPFTVYGPRGRPDMSPWIFLESTLKGRAIPLYGDGSTRRDFTFIGDFVQGFVNSIYRPLGYEIFNLGNSSTVALSECLSTIAEISGKEQVINRLPRQPGDVDVTNADVSKAAKLLDYKPHTSYREGMTIFHKWFVENAM